MRACLQDSKARDFKVVETETWGWVEEKKSGSRKKSARLLCCLMTSVPNGLHDKSHGGPEAKHRLYTSAILECTKRSIVALTGNLVEGPVMKNQRQVGVDLGGPDL